jgi:hypothetical protein
MRQWEQRNGVVGAGHGLVHPQWGRF